MYRTRTRTVPVQLTSPRVRAELSERWQVYANRLFTISLEYVCLSYLLSFHFSKSVLYRHDYVRIAVLFVNAEYQG